jgi:hypothetical protein
LHASVMWQPVLLKFIQIFIHKIITLFKKQLLSEKLQIPKAKTEFFKKTCTYSGLISINKRFSKHCNKYKQKI